MTIENALTTIQPKTALEIVAAGLTMLDLREAVEMISWKQIQEAIDPVGEMIEASAMDGWTFALLRAKPVESSLPDGPDHFYWIVGKREDGVLFNTAIGGRICVEVLDNLLWLNYEHYQAKQRGDTEYQAALEAVGAGKQIVLTFRVKRGGKYGKYYIFD